MDKSSGVTLFNDVEEVYGRLFNHHPVISGEIKYFLKEFEESRKDREVEGLFQVLERTIELRDLHLEKAHKHAEVYLTDVNDDFDKALSVCDRILQSEERHKSAAEGIEEANYLTQRREARAKEWELFMADMTAKTVQVDKDFREEEENLQNYYGKADD